MKSMFHILTQDNDVPTMPFAKWIAGKTQVC